MTHLNRDVSTAILFIAGVWSFIFGQFIVSTVLFATATVVSNIMPKSVSK